MAGSEFTSKFSGASAGTDPNAIYQATVIKYNDGTGELFVKVPYLGNKMRITSIVGVQPSSASLKPGDRVLVGFLDGHMTNPVAIAYRPTASNIETFYDLQGTDDVVLSADMIGPTIRFFQSGAGNVRTMTFPTNWATFISPGTTLKVICVPDPEVGFNDNAWVTIDFSTNAASVLRWDGFSEAGSLDLIAYRTFTAVYHGDNVWVATTVQPYLV